MSQTAQECNVCSMKDAAATEIKSAGKLMEYFHYSIPISAFAANQERQFTVPIYSDSYFVIKKLVADSTGDFQALLTNGATGRYFSNKIRVNKNNIFGTIQLPNRLADPIVMPPSSQMVLDLLDTSAAPNDIQVSMIGYRYFDSKNPPTPLKAGAVLSWFQYVVEFLFATSDTQQGTIRIDADSDFLVRKIVGTNTPGRPYTVTVSDSGSQNIWTDQEQHFNNIVGTAQYPNMLSRPRLVKRNNTINVEVRNITAGANTVQLVFEGAKVYR